MEKIVDLSTILRENPNIGIDELLELKPKEYGINEIEKALKAKYGENFKRLEIVGGTGLKGKIYGIEFDVFAFPGGDLRISGKTTNANTLELLKGYLGGIVPIELTCSYEVVEAKGNEKTAYTVYEWISDEKIARDRIISLRNSDGGYSKNCTVRNLKAFNVDLSEIDSLPFTQVNQILANLNLKFEVKKGKVKIISSGNNKTLKRVEPIVFQSIDEQYSVADIELFRGNGHPFIAEFDDGYYEFGMCKKNGQYELVSLMYSSFNNQYDFDYKINFETRDYLTRFILEYIDRSEYMGELVCYSFGKYGTIHATDGDKVDHSLRFSLDEAKNEFYYVGPDGRIDWEDLSKEEIIKLVLKDQTFLALLGTIYPNLLEAFDVIKKEAKLGDPEK